MRPRAAWWILAFTFILLGVFLPRDWYDALPRNPNLPPPPLKGVTLLQISFVLEGFAFLWLAVKRWTFTRLADGERLPGIVRPTSEGLSMRTAGWYLAAITLLALLLRLLNLNSDLWIDEITPIVYYGKMPPLEVLATYLNSNNHLLNTLLVKLAVAMFGEKEWIIRLPAVIFGTATIPVIYWVGRLTLSRQASLAAALLLAVSYHHIFFSQNARGYTPYLLFSLLSSGLFIRGLQDDRPRIWGLYVVTIFFAVASLLNGVYVLAAHMVVGAVALLVVKRGRSSPMDLSRRLIAVFSATGILCFQLYATALPEVYVLARSVYSDPASGFSLLSGDLLREVVRGVSAGFGSGVLLAALPFLGVAAAGFVILSRRQWALALALTLPEILTAVTLVAARLTLSPRFFLLALPLVILSAVHGVFGLGDLIARTFRKRHVSSSSVAVALVIVLSVVSLVSLKRYYSIPKQPYRASIQYLEAERKPGEIVIVIHLAEVGYRYYGRRFALREGTDYFFVRSVAAFDEVLSSRHASRSFLVTTFPRALHILHPDLEARIANGWTPARVFRASVGDGNITIWKQR